MILIVFFPATLNDVNSSNQQNSLHSPRGGSVISLTDSYLELEFDADQEYKKSIAIATDIRLLNLGSFAFFQCFLITSGRKQLECFDHAHFVSSV